MNQPWLTNIGTIKIHLNILLQAYNLIMSKITRNLIDIVNKVKRGKSSFSFIIFNFLQNTWNEIKRENASIMSCD